jgi:hypothetical protein
MPHGSVFSATVACPETEREYQIMMNSHKSLTVYLHKTRNYTLMSDVEIDKLPQIQYYTLNSPLVVECVYDKQRGIDNT